jgi:hypothetical protein
VARGVEQLRKPHTRRGGWMADDEDGGQRKKGVCLRGNCAACVQQCGARDKRPMGKGCERTGGECR